MAGMRSAPGAGPGSPRRWLRWWAAAAPRTMPNALLVSVPGGSHEVGLTGCIPALSAAFIQAGIPAGRAAWAACARTLGQHYPAFPPGP